MRAYLRRHGIAIEPNSAGEDLGAGGANGGLHYLPNSAVADPPVADSVPLRLQLDCADLSNFARGACYAVTHFGPASLASDKAQNEDFALAGVIDGRNGPVSFGIVADGVTSKTFWAARASRLATFASYETVKACVEQGWQPARGDAEEIDPFVQRLCETIEQRFLEDRAALVSADVAPLTWDAALYRQHRDRLAFWYQTTLLVVVIGSSGGWLVFCGDGGATRLFSDGEQVTDVKVALESPDTVELPAAVSLGVTSRSFKRVFLRPPPAGQSVHVVLSSDGVDRSLKNKRTQMSDLDYTSLDLSSRAAAQSTLEDIARWPEADRDNMSIAHVCSPPDAPWPKRGRVSLPDQAPIAVDQPEAEPTPVPESSALPAPVTDTPPSLWHRYLPQLSGTAAATLLVGVVIGAVAMLLALASGRGSRLVTWLQPRLVAATVIAALLGVGILVTLFVPARVAQRVATATQRSARVIWAWLRVLGAFARTALGAIARAAFRALQVAARMIAREGRRFFYRMALWLRRRRMAKARIADPARLAAPAAAPPDAQAAPADAAAAPSPPADATAKPDNNPAANRAPETHETQTLRSPAAQPKPADLESAGDKL